MAGVSGCLGDSWQSARRKPNLTSDRRAVPDEIVHKQKFQM